MSGSGSKDYLFFPIDVVDFSRGATTGSDFINKINNEDYWKLGLMPRSHMMFDPVGSYDIPGNGIDIGEIFQLRSTSLQSRSTLQMKPEISSIFNRFTLQKDRIQIHKIG